MKFNRRKFNANSKVQVVSRLVISCASHSPWTRTSKWMIDGLLMAELQEINLKTQAHFMSKVYLLVPCTLAIVSHYRA